MAVQWLCPECEVKHRASLVLRREVDRTVKLFNDHFANHETQADAVGVQLLLLVDV